ncbi:DNA-binding protein YbiB [Polynucleobacter sp. SHI8]|uniref:DNA-binding protein YbiB n=1 Tax=unclassified Polynucleobacter TaxID=2640945 RepID=UPI0024935AFC|nr:MULTISPECIES: DNA-binding protein YbiB [unclassified Polynucleobacter]BDW11659.1 DNA-binding protein YbiB [Polynucleobacter sp. SHI2]BDW14106.1 DNA-binding protein YbiB [Polynucleobacter sp. SHI8]
MSISSVIKQIGRGAKGSSDLSREEAKVVFQKILDQEVLPIELGAFCIAMRIKGETTQELAGFMDAIKTDLYYLPTPNRTIVLPSYNGSRKHMNLTPLLAYMLHQLGFFVIVQGVEEFVGRLTTHEVFQAMDWPILQDRQAWPDYEKSQLPIFVPLKIIHPGLHQLLEIRHQLGLRNSGHILAKLLNPCFEDAWQIVNYTHPEYPRILEDFFQLQRANVALMRGSEGEPTSSLLRLPEMNFFKGGHLTYTSQEYRLESESDPSLELIDLHTHCQYLHEVISKKREPFMGIQLQAYLLHQHCTD